MKTPKVLLSVLALIFTLSSQAQVKKFASQLYVGAGGGASLSTLDFEPKVIQENTLGFHGGLSVRYVSEEHIGLQLEANIAKRGWTQKFTDNPDFSYSSSLTYMELPMMTHVYFGNKTRLIVLLGPQVNYLINQSSQISAALQSDVDKQRIDFPDKKYGEQYKPAEKKFDYGLIGGLGVEFRTGIGSFDLEGRYYFGLGDIFNSGVGSAYSRSAQRVAEARLTYFIQLF